MAVGHFFEFHLIRQIARHGQARRPDKFIGDAAQSGHHHDDRLFFSLNNLLDIQDAFCGTYGCSSKFQYFHFCILQIKSPGKQAHNTCIDSRGNHNMVNFRLSQ